VARPWDKEEYLHPTNYVTSQAIDFLRRRDPRKPFFLFVSYHRPHPPYDPPGWAFDLYKDAQMPDPPVGDWIEVMSPYAQPERPDCYVGQADPRALQRARAGYYGHMSHIDGQISRLLEVLAEYGQFDNSLICFTSDHGEMMGDHHMWRKAYPYEGSARVPLIVRGPAESGIHAGSIVDKPVELRDIMPTLLHAVGAAIPESVEGQSALPLMRGEAVPWRPYLHGEHTVLGQSLQWVTDGAEKYIWFSGDGHEQLFDLENDPQELHDLAGEATQAERMAFWRERLVLELTGREEGFTDGKALIPGRPVDPVLGHLRAQAAAYLDRPKGSWEKFL
jgi:arylsulfatase A-like enzyme